MMAWLLIAIFALTVVGVLLFAGVEAATLAVNRKTLREKLLESGEATDKAFGVVSDIQRAMSISLVGVNLSALIGVFALHEAMRSWLGDAPIPGVPLLLTALIAAPLYLLAGEVFARPLFRPRAAAYLLAIRLPLRVCDATMPPLLKACTRVTSWALGPFGIERAVAKRPMTASEILELVGEPETFGRPEVSEQEMIHGAIDLEESNVREVMRPLVDVVALKAPEATVASALELARAWGYTRFPVFRERIIEMNEYVDITRILREGVREGPLAPYIRPALMVPETMRISSLLRALTEERQHCAIVFDEFGGVVGWVTREDVLEEIVGDIADKDSDEEPGWEQDERGFLHVDARIDLDDLAEETDIELAKGDDYDTLGGWLYTRLERIPRVGDVAETEEARVRVEAMDGHIITRAGVERIEPDD